MNWTDERVEKLKKLWSEGLSASQIAAQLGGVSRNAVIGKVHRLNLPGRAKAGGTATTARAPKRNTSAPRAPNYASRIATRTVTRQQGATMLKDEIEIETVEELEYVPAKNVVVPI
jgi:GcrA cell cycle regulator